MFLCPKSHPGLDGSLLLPDLSVLKLIADIELQQPNHPPVNVSLFITDACVDAEILLLFPVSGHFSEKHVTRT